jgi:hypothetical protein
VGHDQGGRPIAVAVEPPPAEREPVGEHGAVHRPVHASEPGAVLVRDEAAAIGVREKHVVVLRQEAWRRRRFRIGPRSVRKVEELAIPFVPKSPQPGAKPLDHGAQPRQARPRRHVRHRRRPEGGQVAKDDVVDRRLGDERTTQPGFRGGRADLSGMAPDTPRRDLDEGEEAPARIGERGGLMLREALLERGAQLAARARPLGEQRASEGEDGVEVDAA